MKRESALAHLGLSGSEDTATIARVYGERLATVHDRLLKATTDAERSECQAQLAQLVESYELVTQSGRYTQAPAANESSATSERIEPGAVLAGRFEIGALLGQGGMGNVYAARDRLKGEEVAIKVLRQDLLSSSTAKERFLEEARVSCSLSHPNIVRVHDVGVSGNYYYFSMERLKGHSLRQHMETCEREHRQFSAAEVMDIARQLVDALRYAHRWIVHRDIKPENIWLAEDGTVKLMDFGIARAYSSVHMTQTGVTLGTAYYMAPEQRVAAKGVDWRADQYSLGVVLYELLAGTLPTGAVQPLEAHRRDVPKRYARALMRAMSAKPADRFPTLADMLAQMQAPERKIAVGLGAVLLLAAGSAAAVSGFYLFTKPAPQPVQSAAAPQTLEAPARESKPKEPAITTAASRGAANSLPPPGSGRGEPVKSPSGTDTRRQECITQCERDSGECRSLSRRGKQDCMRAVAFGGSGRITNTNALSTSCAFYGQARCARALDRDACMARISSRYEECVQLVGNIAARRQDCEERARDSDKLCLDELRDCRAGC